LFLSREFIGRNYTETAAHPSIMRRNEEELAAINAVLPPGAASADAPPIK
jgi:hypothetical protein